MRIADGIHNKSRCHTCADKTIHTGLIHEVPDAY
jgi:hypothetical protein